MATLEELESRIEQIEKRNKKVELDKKWETSFSRKIMIMAITYVLISTYMFLIGVETPLVAAIIPTLGFFLSTLTLQLFKNLWLKNK